MDNKEKTEPAEWERRAVETYSMLREAHKNLEESESKYDEISQTFEFYKIGANSYINKLSQELSVANQLVSELRARLATPVRLPDISPSFCADSDKAQGHHIGQEYYRDEVIEAIRTAGYSVIPE